MVAMILGFCSQSRYFHIRKTPTGAHTTNAATVAQTWPYQGKFGAGVGVGVGLLGGGVGEVGAELKGEGGGVVPELYGEGGGVGVGVCDIIKGICHSFRPELYIAPDPEKFAVYYIKL